jgi:murein DD-endopeptidase MepM/ murein hydrolase activator NlpD
MTKNPPETEKALNPSRSDHFLVIGSWMIAFSLVLIAVYLDLRIQNTKAAQPDPQAPVPTQISIITPNSETATVSLPEIIFSTSIDSIFRRSTLHTSIPTRPRQDVISYTVTTGDSVFGIAQNFNIEPETVLWSNYENLNDNPDMLSPGMELNIPPINGVFYQWQEGDTFESIGAEFKANPEDILNWPGNHFDLTNPLVTAGDWILIPNGERAFQQWLIPTIARDNSGVSPSLLGPGACAGSYDGAYGSGAFAWPTSQHVLSGNDYWSGHLGIDIAGALGDGVFSTDAGVIVFSGWAYGGYGNMIMIDHGNGYQSLYAHLSSVSAHCGQSVYTGTYIGALGSTGNSTGAHLHFEVRYLGGFINPWFVLPAP